MITLNNVKKCFGQKTVLNGLSHTFYQGKISCVLGPSGCGKTTLLNLLAGTTKCDSGTICAPNQISYVFQDDLLIPQQTVFGNLKLVLKSAYKDKFQLNQVIDSHLDLCGLSDSAHLYPHQLSGGMRQRLALVRGFAFKSQLLLMDEPFKTLDIALRNSLLSEFLALYDSRTVIFVTHDIDEALLTADFIYVFDKSMSLLNTFEINENKAKRKLYDTSLISIKTQFYKLVELND